jgi:hypothetical protein
MNDLATKRNESTQEGQANPERDAALPTMTQPNLRAKLILLRGSNLGDGFESRLKRAMGAGMERPDAGVAT